MIATSQPRVRVTVVTSPACHFCEEAERTLDELSSSFVFDVERLAIDSLEGQELIQREGAAFSPLVLVNGHFFSSGKMSKKKLTKLLTASAEPISAFEGN